MNFCQTPPVSSTSPFEVFVFGSNLAGRHGAGAAKEALAMYGAIYGIGEGFFGRSYAIPTKDELLRPRPLEYVTASVLRFQRFARSNPNIIFRLTRVGCGLAGQDPADMARLFDRSPPNVLQPDWLSG